MLLCELIQLYGDIFLQDLRLLILMTVGAVTLWSKALTRTNKTVYGINCGWLGGAVDNF